MRSRAALILGLLLCAFAVAPAWADKRIALVIGNSAYQNVPRLANPANDASAVVEMFRKAQFEVVEAKRDLNNADMRRALRDFADRSRDADMAVVFYAGHGIEIDGQNYLVPVDALLARDSDAYDEAITLERVLQVIEPARKLRLVILDACRDNPFARTMRRTLASRSLGRGLVGVEPGKPNTLIAFAAKGGSTADDGTGANSPFTTALLKHLTTPGLDLRKAFGLIRDDVIKATGSRQEPFVYGSLGGSDVSLVPAPAPQAAPTQPAANPQAEVRRDYELALQLGNRQAWEFFIQQYPNGFYANLARVQLDKITAEEARAAATEKARQAEAEKARLAAEQASAATQQKAAREAKAAEDARLAAEKLKLAEQAKAEAAERSRIAAERAAADKQAKEKAEAEAKAKAVADAKAAREKIDAERAAKAAEDKRLDEEKKRREEQAKAEAAERVRLAAERAKAEKEARERIEAEAKAIREKALAEARAIREAAEAEAKAAERVRVAAAEQAKAEQARIAAEKAATDKASAEKAAETKAAEDKSVQLAALPADGSKIGLSQPEINRLLQLELRRVGCHTASLNDDWNAASRRSLDLFNKHAGQKLDIKLASLDALDAVKSKQARICPLVCEHGFRANGERCEKIVCRAGYVVGDDNTCEKRPARPVAKGGETTPPPKRETAAQKPQAVQMYCPPSGIGVCRPVQKGCRLVERLGTGTGTFLAEVCN